MSFYKLKKLTNLIYFYLTFHILKADKFRNVRSSENVMAPICSRKGETETSNKIFHIRKPYIF